MTKILIECPAKIASVQVGVLNALQPLIEAGACEARFLETVKIRKEHIAWCDVLITVRGCEAASCAVVDAAKRTGRFVVYFLDDDLLNVPENIGSSSYFHHPMRKKYLLRALAACDVLWVVNPLMETKYAQVCAAPCVACPSPVSLPPFPENKGSGKVKILYAGSTDHAPLLRRFIAPAVRRLCEERAEDVEFFFIGASPGLRDLAQVKHRAFIDDYETYKQEVLQGGFHIGLAVIDDDEFYYCKYYNKYLEYTRIGAVGIYTNCMPYTMVVRDGVNGFLSRNTQTDWYETMNRAIDAIRRDDRTMLRNAYEHIGKELIAEVTVGVLKAKIPQLTSFAVAHKETCEIRLAHTGIMYYVTRIKELWYEHKILFLPFLLYKACRKMLNKFRKNPGRT